MLDFRNCQSEVGHVGVFSGAGLNGIRMQNVISDPFLCVPPSNLKLGLERLLWLVYFSEFMGESSLFDNSHSNQSDRSLICPPPSSGCHIARHPLPTHRQPTPHRQDVRRRPNSSCSRRGVATRGSPGSSRCWAPRCCRCSVSC